MGWHRHIFFEASLIGLLLGIGFVVPAFWFMGLIGVGWFVHATVVSKKINWKWGWYIWFIKALLCTSWLWAIYPIDWLGIELGSLELPLIGFYWSTVAVSLSFGGMVIVLLLQQAAKFLRTTQLYIATPLLWVVAEIASSLVFSILLYGPGGSIGFAFSMGYLGYLLGEHQVLVELSRLAGVYGLSISLVALSLGGLWLYKNQTLPVVFVAMVLLVLTSVIDISSSNQASDETVVAVIDTYIAEADWSDPDATVAELTKAIEAAKATGAQHIILPEDSRAFDRSLPEPLLLSYLQFIHGQDDVIIIDSGRTSFGEYTATEATIFDSKTASIFQSHKRYLVPQGEFMPTIYRFLFSLFEQSETTSMLGGRLSYRVGPSVEQTHFASHVPGVLFCFEVVDPRGVRKIMQERSREVPFIAHVVSHAWIHESRIFRHELETMLRVQALWNKISIVTAGNFVPGNIITADGEVIDMPVAAEGEKWQVKVGTIHPR